MEGAVGERDVLPIGTWFEAVCLEYPQCGVPGVTVASGAARRFGQFLAKLVGALVEDRPR